MSNHPNIEENAVAFTNVYVSVQQKAIEAETGLEHGSESASGFLLDWLSGSDTSETSSAADETWGAHSDGVGLAPRTPGHLAAQVAERVVGPPPRHSIPRQGEHH